MIKGPTLLCIDHRAGTVRRYLRQYDFYVAGMGWHTVCKGEATYDPVLGLALDVVEQYRTIGSV